jgi:pimeloyl-ACP methyl ester carboxylesterase
VSNFVLVHGAWHGAWCWQKLVPLLEAQGHRIAAPDLLGLGDDRTPLARATLENWTEQICRVVDAQPGKVILVGHSRGGLIVSQVAERRPDKIAKVVYLTAMLIENGESGLGTFARIGPSTLQDYLVVAPDGGSMTVKDEGLKPAFYGMCADADVALAKRLLRPEPLEPSNAPVTTTDRNFGRVPRVFIECLRDDAITPAMQKAMYRAMPCERVISMDTDHSPFFSAPAELARHLGSL